jgi:hypothetical protein
MMTGAFGLFKWRLGTACPMLYLVMLLAILFPNHIPDAVMELAQCWSP